MKTEELLAYQEMYAAMRQALGTPWLTFEPRADQAPAEGEEADQPEPSRDACSGTRK